MCQLRFKNLAIMVGGDVPVMQCSGFYSHLYLIILYLCIYIFLNGGGGGGFGLELDRLIIGGITGPPPGPLAW